MAVEFKLKCGQNVEDLGTVARRKLWGRVL